MVVWGVLLGWVEVRVGVEEGERVVEVVVGGLVVVEVVGDWSSAIAAMRWWFERMGKISEEKLTEKQVCFCFPRLDEVVKVE